MTGNQGATLLEIQSRLDAAEETKESQRLTVLNSVVEIWAKIQVLTGGWYKFCEHLMPYDDSRCQTICTQIGEICKLIKAAPLFKPLLFAEWENYLASWIKDFARTRHILVEKLMRSRETKSQ